MCLVSNQSTPSKPKDFGNNLLLQTHWLVCSIVLIRYECIVHVIINNFNLNVCWCCNNRSIVNWCTALLILIQITQAHQPLGRHPWAHRGSLVPMTHWRNKPSLLIYWINVALIHCLIHALMQCLWPIGSLVHNIVASDRWAHGFLEWSVDDTIDSYLLLASSNASDSSVRWFMSDCFNDSLMLILLCIGPS